MSDRLATIDMGREEGAAVPLSRGGAESPSNTTWPGQTSTSVICLGQISRVRSTFRLLTTSPRVGVGCDERVYVYL